MDDELIFAQSASEADSHASEPEENGEGRLLRVRDEAAIPVS